MKNMDSEMRDKFKQIDLDDLGIEPLDGHAERFETKLLVSNQKVIKIRRNRKVIWSLIAAASLVGFLVLFVFQQTIQPSTYAEDESTKRNTLMLADYSLEAGQKQKYFEERLNEKKNSLDVDSDPKLKELVLTLNRLEGEYQVLQSKLSENFHNEHLINAVLVNYQLRLEVLERIQKFIQVNNRIKTQKDDKIIS